MIYLLLLTAILYCVSALERAGPFNQFARLPFYTGARTEDWDSKKVILNDDPSVFYWNYKVNVDDRNNLWVADGVRHIVYFISKETETWNAIFRVAGNANKAGARDGNIGAALFNSPESVAIQTLNETKIEMAKNLKPVWLANVTDEACKNIH